MSKVGLLAELVFRTQQAIKAFRDLEDNE